MLTLVSIFRPDGSGKSTQARILGDYLRSRGLKVKVIWIKSYHTFAFVLSRLYKKLSPRSVSLNTYGHVIRINTITQSHVNRSIWSLIEFLSILMKSLICSEAIVALVGTDGFS